MPKEQLLQFIHYSNLIYQTIITESALLLAAIESLDMRGALPVGELGKAMSYQSHVLVISKYIKDKYTGLKKFLELYPSIFVISNDHAHNPHVYLRSRLSPDHQRICQSNALKGDHLLSIDIMVKYRMVRSIIFTILRDVITRLIIGKAISSNESPAAGSILCFFSSRRETNRY